MSPLPRRGFLSGLASLPLAGAAALTISSARATGSIASLWAALLAARGRKGAYEVELSAAEARLPWWAVCGFDSRDHEGNLCGQVVGWPAIQDGGLALVPGSRRLIRFGPDMIEHLFDIERGVFGEKGAGERKARRLSELAVRRAAQRAEREKVGLPALEDAFDAACEEVNDQEEAILALAPESADVIAAQVMTTAAFETIDIDATRATHAALSVAAVALAGLLPHLSSELAADAAEFLEKDRPLRDMRADRGTRAALVLSAVGVPINHV